MPSPVAQLIGHLQKIASLLRTCHLRSGRERAGTALPLRSSRDLSVIPAGSVLTAGPALAMPAAAQEEAAAFCDPLSKKGRNCLQPAGGS